MPQAYYVEPVRQRPEYLSRRFYKIGFVVSAVLNVLLVTGFWYYLHIEGTLSMIWDAVDLIN